MKNPASNYNPISEAPRDMTPFRIVTDTFTSEVAYRFNGDQLQWKSAWGWETTILTTNILGWIAE